MRRLNIGLLTEWLGAEGAVSGLEHSTLSNAELLTLAKGEEIYVDRKRSRREICIELVSHSLRRIDRPVEEILGMSPEEIRKYLSDRLVSAKEMHNLLDSLGIGPPRTIREKLIDYAAREIGELGLFQRISKGNER